MSKKYAIDMTKGNLWKQILSFSLPLMASSVLQLLFNAADIIVVGKFAGDNSLAAVSSTGSLVSLLVNFFIGISIGTNVIVARYIGAKKDDDAYLAVHTSILASIIFGIGIGILGIVIAKPMLVLMDSPADVIDLSTLYLKIYFLGAPANLLYNFGAAVLRAKGDTKRPLYFLSIAGILNVLLNLLLVIVFNLDVAGVAIATIFSQLISAILVTLCLCKEEGNTKLNIKDLKIDITKLIELLKVGIPCGLQSVVFSLSNMVIQSSVNSFGATVMAGNGAASNIESFVYMIMNAFCQSCQTFIGQNLGAKNHQRIIKTMLICQIYVIIFGLVFGIGGWYFGKQLLSIYSDSSEVIAAGHFRMGYFCRTYVLCGIMDVFVGGSRGLGSSVEPMICSLFFTCALRILWIWTVFKANPSMHNIYISYPISWIITGIAQGLFFIFLANKVKKKILC